MMLPGLCAKVWFGIARIEADVAAGDVDAVHGDIVPIPKGKKAEAIALVLVLYQVSGLRAP